MLRYELEDRVFRMTAYPPHNHLECTWDMVSWRRNHDLCESCGVPFQNMDPMTDMIQHWTGSCAWHKSDTDLVPAAVASMALVELLQDVSRVVPPTTIEANKLRLAIRLLRDFPRLLKAPSGD
jgi:hypothetical protein